MAARIARTMVPAATRSLAVPMTTVPFASMARRRYSSASDPPPALYAFDKLRLVQKLEETGLPRSQAEIVMASISEVIGERCAVPFYLLLN